jgi:hypothetical protein
MGHTGRDSVPLLLYFIFSTKQSTEYFHRNSISLNYPSLWTLGYNVLIKGISRVLEVHLLSVLWFC